MAAVSPLFLVVDAGGTSCRVLIFDKEGSLVASAEGGEANCTVLGLDAGARVILSTLASARQVSRPFAGAWMGVAGADDAGTCARLHDLLLSFEPGLVTDAKDSLVTNDCDLLAAAIPLHGLQAGITLIAGTGSNAMAFAAAEDAGRFFPFEAVGRVGGWGHVLGDEGSGYWLGREAVRVVLAHRFDAHPAALPAYDNSAVGKPFELIDRKYRLPAPSDTFVAEMLAQVGSKHLDDLLADVMAGTPEQVKARIAALAPLVTRYASDRDNLFAVDIVREAAGFHARAAHALLRHSLKEVAPEQTVLILGGSVFHKCSMFAETVKAFSKTSGFGKVVVVDDAAKLAGEALTRLWRERHG